MVALKQGSYPSTAHMYNEISNEGVAESFMKEGASKRGEGQKNVTCGEFVQ